MLQVHNLTRYFHHHRVLNHVSFSVEKGTSVGLMGTSGSGKSTLLRCIQGLDRPNEGQITCSGKVGMMLQDYQLFPHMTVLENITYVPRKVLGLKREDAEQQAHHLLHMLGLQLKDESFPHQLSGGQKQRVALMRALAAQPEILLCDEPTSALDSGTIQELCALFRKVSLMGVSMFIVSHDLSFLAQVTQRLLVLKNGEIHAEFKATDQGYNAKDLEQVQKILSPSPQT